MGRLKTIARRSFLVGSVAVVGGVAFGTYMATKPLENPLSGQVGEGEATFNPYVKIDAGKITLITPHSDVGQGVAQMQAMLIAEEMDLDPGQFEVSFGVPSPAYYNTGLAADAVPFLPTDESMVANLARGAVEKVFRVAGLQVTGGSSSVPDSYEKLRVAGAVARETLKAAAAKRTGLSVDELKTESGAVVLPDGTAVPYRELAAEAAGIDPVTDITLRDMSQARLIGTPQMRLDMVAKCTGTQTYGIDLQMDGMVHATLRTNPRRGGVISYDDKAALALPGVQNVLEVRGGVAVIADTTWQAFQGAEAVEFEWGDAAYPAEQDDHWAAVADSFAPETLDKEWRNDGDVQGALSTADEVIEAEYRAPYVAHQPLEPLSVTIKVAVDRVDIWTAHQVPRFAESRVAEITGVDVENVHLHNMFGGGSFGHRLEFDYIDRTAEAAMQVPDTPVKMTLRREEDFAQDFNRQISIGRMQGSARDGQVDAYDLNIASPSAAASQMGRMGFGAAGPDTQIAAGAWNMPYAVPHLRVAAYKTPELAPISSWRSVGASTAAFFAEGFLDELIHAAGADPLEERLRMVNNPIARAVLEEVGKMSDWGSDLGAGRGRGLAMTNSFGVDVAEVVEVTMTEDGIKVDKVFVAAEVGRVIDPVNFENNVQGGVVFALGHAMNSEMTYSDGMVEQANYYDAEGMRFHQAPEIFVKGLENGDRVLGIGEPPVPPAAPALANAIFAATGQRLREMPFFKAIDFV